MFTEKVGETWCNATKNYIQVHDLRQFPGQDIFRFFVLGPEQAKEFDQMKRYTTFKF